MTSSNGLTIEITSHQNEEAKQWSRTLKAETQVFESTQSTHNAVISQTGCLWKLSQPIPASKTKICSITHESLKKERKCLRLEGAGSTVPGNQTKETTPRTHSPLWLLSIGRLKSPLDSGHSWPKPLRRTNSRKDDLRSLNSKERYSAEESRITASASIWAT